MSAVNEIIEKARNIVFADDQRILIAIDGRCAAGKSTLADRLREKAGWSVFHMDDFFLRPEQRTARRLNTPGENVDHERFLEEILIPLKNGSKEISFRPFDCKTQSLSEPIRVEPERICVIEGSYSCHPELREYYDLRIFLNVDSGEQIRRIILRNGEEKARQFSEKWIPLEEKYFSAFNIPSECDMVIKHTFE